MPSIIGASSSPASVGLAPVTAWRKSGTNTVTANSAAVPRNSAALATATAGARSRRERHDRVGRPARAQHERAGQGQRGAR